MTQRRTDLVPLLRFICVVLAVLGELWILQPITSMTTYSPLDGVLRSGNLAYAGLFALSAFAMTRLLLHRVDKRVLPAVAAGLRHTATVLPVLLLTCGAAALVGLLDSTDTTSAEITRQSISHVLSFDWNSYVREHPLAVRTDLVPLWFFSVEAQLLLGLLALIVALGRFPRLLVVLLVAGISASFVWSLVVYADRGWFETSLRMDTHIDEFLCGALAAVLTRQPRWSRQGASSLVGCGALGLVGLVLFSSRMTLDESFHGVASLGAVVMALMLAAAASSDGSGKVFDLVAGVPALRDAGRSWAYLLAFGAPVFAFVSRHTVTWDGTSRLLAAFGLLAVVGYVVNQVLLPLALAAGERVRRRRGRTREPDEVSAGQLSRLDGD